MKHDDVEDLDPSAEPAGHRERALAAKQQRSTGPRSAPLHKRSGPRVHRDTARSR